MRVRYFPEIYPEESAYSVIARYHHHTGSRALDFTIEALMGDPHLKVDVELPYRLNTVSERINGRRSAADIAIDHTSLPYYAAFRGRRDRLRALEGVCDRGAAVTLLGSIGARDRQKATLHYCFECELEMRDLHGETYWRRDHQIPTVLICPTHGQFLRDSGIVRNSRVRSFHRPAHKAPGLKPVCADMELLPRLLRLTRISCDLLQWDNEQFTLEVGQPKLDQLIRSKGYVLRNQKLDLKNMAIDLLPYFQKLYDIWPQLHYSIDKASSWIFNVHGHSYSSRHPLFHILLRDALEQRPDGVGEPVRSDKDGAFGSGPWSCINPLAGHFGRKVIRSIKRYNGRHREEGAIFACSCGYIYRQKKKTSGEITPPTRIVYGKLLDELIQSAFRKGWTLNRTARAAKLTDATLFRYLVTNKIEHPWSARRFPMVKMKPSPAPIRKPRIRNRATGKTNAYSAKELREIDLNISRRINEKAAEIRRRVPAERASRYRICREIGSMPVVAPERIPRITQALDQCAEATPDFRRRRIIKFLDELGDGARPTVRRLASMVGCPHQEGYQWVSDLLVAYDAEGACLP